MKVRAKRDPSCSYTQCFICRQWGWDVSKAFDRVRLCLPCYVDVLEVKQARGGKAALWRGERSDSNRTDVSRETESGSEPQTGQRVPSPFVQLDMFD